MRDMLVVLLRVNLAMIASNVNHSRLKAPMSKVKTNGF